MTAKLPGKHVYTNVYFPQEMVDEMLAECARVQRPINWLMRRVWTIARDDIRRMPAK